MKMLGIDPGLQCAGYAIMERTAQTITIHDYGALRLSPRHTLAARVTQFHDFFADKIAAHQVTDLTLETPFLGKNAQNFLKLGYLRGILYLLSQQHNLVIHEYAPREVKVAVTGFGGASKEQVARVVGQLFTKAIQATTFDVTDALAITLCGLWHTKPAR